MTDSAAEPTPEPTAPEPTSSDAPEPATCPWCAAVNAADATRCSACGAALAQRESIGDLRIPGLTSVDPALEDYDKRPLHLRGPSPSQGMAPALIIGAVAGGPIGLVAIGGVAAVAGAEYLGTRVGAHGGQGLEEVGKPQEVVLQALQQLDAAKDDPAAAPEPATATDAEPDAATDPAADDGGMSIWRDLPPPVVGADPDVGDLDLF